MSWLLLITLLMVMVGAILYKRNRHQLKNENKVRESLGLPLLTTSEFNAEPPDYAGNFRCNINQHQ